VRVNGPHYGISEEMMVFGHLDPVVLWNFQNIVIFGFVRSAVFIDQDN
jgi:hypothetical protein